MKIRIKKKIDPIRVFPDDAIRLSYKQVAVSPLGKVIGVIREEEILKSKVGRSMTLNEAIIFDVEAGDFGRNVKDGIGGAFLCE